MELRIPEAGDEVDGHIIEDIGEPRVINDNHTVVFARMRDGKYELISISDFRVDRPAIRLWETDNEDLRRALDTSVEFPIATRGGSEQIRVTGSDARGKFTGTLYYNDKKLEGAQDTFAYH